MKSKVALRSLAVLALAICWPACVGASASAEELVKSRFKLGAKTFDEAGCAQCHKLQSAEATGSYAPSFDGNKHLTVDLIRKTVSEGRGDMPSFGGIFSEEQIKALSEYIMSAKK